MEPHELINVAEAAKITGLDKMTVYRLARVGRLRSFKILGTALRFDRRDVLALIRERPAIGTSTDETATAASVAAR